MTNCIKNRLALYRRLNAMAKNEGVAFIGGSMFAGLPVAELCNGAGISTVVYNRGIEGISLAELTQCVDALLPNVAVSKLFVGVGEYDAVHSDFSEESFRSEYEALLKRLEHISKAEIYLLALPAADENSIKANQIIKALARKYGCEYIAVHYAAEQNQSLLNLFKAIHYDLRTSPISFADAMLCG